MTAGLGCVARWQRAPLCVALWQRRGFVQSPPYSCSSRPPRPFVFLVPLKSVSFRWSRGRSHGVCRSYATPPSNYGLLVIGRGGVTTPVATPAELATWKRYELGEVGQRLARPMSPSTVTPAGTPHGSHLVEGPPHFDIACARRTIISPSTPEEQPPSREGCISSISSWLNERRVE